MQYGWLRASNGSSNAGTVENAIIHSPLHPQTLTQAMERTTIRSHALSMYTTITIYNQYFKTNMLFPGLWVNPYHTLLILSLHRTRTITIRIIVNTAAVAAAAVAMAAVVVVVLVGVIRKWWVHRGKWGSPASSTPLVDATAGPLTGASWGQSFIYTPALSHPLPHPLPHPQYHIH